MANNKRQKLNIFVSHNHDDNSFGYKLVDDLRHILNEDDNVWYDSKSGRYDSNEGLRAGDNWQRVINQRISQCNVFIILLSKKAIRSGWVRFELDLIIPRTVTGRVRIIPIRLDDCKIPIELVNRYQIIEYRSQNDYRTALDELLKGLSLPPYPVDQDSSIANYAIRWADAAFDSEDWKSAVERIYSIINRFQDFASSSIYFKLAISLLKLGETQQSKLAIEKGLQSEMSGEDEKLLQKYIEYLVYDEKWEIVLYCSDLLLSKNSNNKYWQEAKNYVLKHIISYKNSKEISSVTKNLSENDLLTNLGFADTVTALKDSESISSEFFSEEILPRINPLISEKTIYTSSEMDEINSNQVEEREANSAGTVVKNIALYLSGQTVQKVFSSSSSQLAGAFNAVGFTMVASRWQFSHLLIWFAAILVFTVFLLGRTTKSDFCGFILSISIALFWCFIGYNIGDLLSIVSNKLDISLNEQTSYCINVILTLFCGFSLYRCIFSS